jgi:hypothetical protein
MASALHAFLLDAKLSQYTEEITKLGATEVADLAEADDSELKAIGMTPVEVKRLRRKAAAATDSTTATAGVGSVIQAGGGGGQMLVPATGSTQWTYLDGTGAEHGPFAVAQLQEWYRAGQLTMDRKLRPAGGAGGFLPLSSIAELVSQLQSGQQPTVRVEQQSVAPKRDSRGGSGGFSGVYIVLEPATVRAGCNINSVALGDLSPGTQVYPPTTTPSPPNSLLLVASILFVV